MFMNDIENPPRTSANGTAVYPHHERVRRYPLHQAIASGRVDIMQLLLDKGYGIDAVDDDGRTPLIQAAIIYDAVVTEALLAAGADVNFRCRRKGMSALDHAVVVGSMSVAKVIVEHGVDINAADAEGGTALHRAASSGNAEKMSLLLLANGATVDVLDRRGCTALQRAALSGNMAVTQALLAAGTDVTIKCNDGKSALDRATSRRFRDIAKVIIEHGVEHGVDVNAEGTAGRIALHVAALFDMAEVVDVLMEAGANIEREDDGGNTPLHIALGRSSSTATAALLKHGASVIKQNSQGYSPLHFAAATAGDAGATMVDVLVESGANIELEDDDGNTPLHAALGTGSFSAAVALLNHSASVGKQNSQGYSPLHFAAATAGAGGATRIVDLLLRKGADEKAVANDGKTAADVVGSLMNEAEDVRELLLNAAADRAWRRRGFLVLCRAHCSGGRVQLGHGIARTHGGIAPTRSLVAPSGAEADWVGLASMLMGMGADPVSRMGDGADCIFRIIMGYL